MGSKILHRVLSIVNGAKTWNIKISVSKMVLFRGSIEYFCYIIGQVRFLLYTLKWRFKADRLQMMVVAKKYICVATVHQ